MRTLIVAGMFATTACAQAPAGLSGFLLHQKEVLLVGPGYLSSVTMLRPDMSYHSIVRESVFEPGDLNQGDRVVRQADEGTFTYTRVGQASATLTLTSSKGLGTVTKDLVFESERTGSGFGYWHLYTQFSLSSIAEAPLVNTSARGTASASKPLILGFYVSERPRYVLVRAIGPSLAQFKVPDSAEDTLLEIVPSDASHSGSTAANPRNDDWGIDPDHEIEPGATSLVTSVGAFMGAFPLREGSKDAAIVLRFPPGAYTAVIRTKSDTSAEVLAEVYIVP